MAQNEQLEKQNSELQAIVENGGLINRGATESNKDFIANLM